MTFDAFNFGMRRIHVSREFGIHWVTGLPAELWCLHVLNRTVRELTSNDQVQDRRHPKKPGQALQCSPAIEVRSRNAFPYPAFSEVNAHWDEQKSSEEYRRQDQKDDDADVRIIHMAANLLR